jgi:hypothetical protein
MFLGMRLRAENELTEQGRTLAKFGLFAVPLGIFFLCVGFPVAFLLWSWERSGVWCARVIETCVYGQDSDIE